MREEFDILDVIDNPAGEWYFKRWHMTYRDGSTRRSQYRFDLIRDGERTILTRKAYLLWPEWEGRVEETSGEEV